MARQFTMKRWEIDRREGYLRVRAEFTEGYTLHFVAASRNKTGQSGLGSVFLYDTKQKELAHFEVRDNNAYKLKKS